jgi:cytochrome c oxidase subunit I
MGRSWSSSAIVPLAVGAFGNYLVPLQIGAPDMAFPKLNMMSYWVYAVGGVIMLMSFFAARRRGAIGLDVLSAAIGHRRGGTDVVARRHDVSDHSSLLGSVNFLVTIIQLRAPGLTFMKLPFFVWAQFVTSFLLLLAFPPLEAAA